MTRHFITGLAIGAFLFLAFKLLSMSLASDCGLWADFGRDTCADDIARGLAVLLLR